MSGRGRVRARGPGRRAGPGRGQGEGLRMCGGGIPRAARTLVTDEIHTTIIDHGLSLRDTVNGCLHYMHLSTKQQVCIAFYT